MMKERDERLFKADEAMEAIYFPEVDDGEESEENVQPLIIYSSSEDSDDDCIEDSWRDMMRAM